MVKERVRRTRLDAVALVAGTVVLLSSVLLTFFLSSYDLEKQSARKAEISVTHVNSLLQKTQRVAHTVLALSGRECTQRLKSDLQREVIVTSNIRTVSLVSNGRVYCSSVYGDTVERDRPSIFMDNSLLLMKGSRLAENIPVVVFRENSPDRKKAVLVEIDGYFISNIMYMAESKLPAYFLIGDLYLTERNNVVSKTALPLGKRYELHSNYYPFSVIYVISFKQELDYLLSDNVAGILVCFIISVSVFMVVNNKRKQPDSPLQALDWAVNHGHLVPFIQPIKDVSTGETCGGEVLVRWLHPQTGLIPPDQFIPLAETSGLITSITYNLILDINQLINNLGRILPENFYLSFNISKQTLINEVFIADLIQLIDSGGLKGIKLVFEITERDNMEVNDIMVEAIDKLRLRGVLFALDDFGTGYSTYHYLQNLSVDYIKVDKSFIQMIGNDSISHHIVENVIALAQKIMVKIIAEGVETESQLNYLKQHQVNYVQGFLLGRPIPADVFFLSLRDK